MNKQIDDIISQLNALKTSNKEISKSLLKKWDESMDVTELKKKMTVNEMRELCNHFDLKEKGEKKLLANRLWEYWESLESESDSDSDSDFDSDLGSSDEE